MKETTRTLNENILHYEQLCVTEIGAKEKGEERERERKGKKVVCDED